MNEEKLKQIEKEAKQDLTDWLKDSGYERDDEGFWRDDNGDSPDLVFQDLVDFYITGATTEASKALPLLEALKKIDAMSFHKNKWKEMAEIGEIAKQAITNYKNHP